MISLPEEFDKWDLITTSNELENLVVQKFGLDETRREAFQLETGTKLYTLYRLDQDPIFNFLKKQERKYDYWLVGSKGTVNEGNSIANFAMNE